MSSQQLLMQRKVVWSVCKASFTPVHSCRGLPVVKCATSTVVPRSKSTTVPRSKSNAALRSNSTAGNQVSAARMHCNVSANLQAHNRILFSSGRRTGSGQNLHVPFASLGGAGDSVPLPPESDGKKNEQDKVISEEFSKKVKNSFTGSTQTLLRFIIDAGIAYDRALQTNPILTKATTCFITFMIGDIIAQSFQGNDPFDVMRMLRLGLYGLLIDGPFGHTWYTWLDKTVYPDEPNSTKAVLTKTAADQLIWSVAMTPVFFATLCIFEGKPDMILPTIERKVVPTLLANYMVWPLAHLINFKFVPTNYRLLYNNIVCIAWTTFMSWITYQAVHYV